MVWAAADREGKRRKRRLEGGGVVIYGRVPYGWALKFEAGLDAGLEAGLGCKVWSWGQSRI